MGKNEEKDFIEYLLKIIKSNDDELKSFSTENYIETKNGIFLSYVHHIEEDLNSYNIIVRG
jgi:hypothetical protein